MLRQNVCGLDRLVRIGLGVALLGIGFGVIQGVAGTVVGLIGLVPLATGVIGWCPAYLPFGIRTCRSA